MDFGVAVMALATEYRALRGLIDHFVHHQEDTSPTPAQVVSEDSNAEEDSCEFTWGGTAWPPSGYLGVICEGGRSSNIFYGAQVGVFNRPLYIPRRGYETLFIFNGLQFGLSNRATFINGAQIGWLNDVLSLNGVQIGLLRNFANSLNGYQSALCSHAYYLTGFQGGVFSLTENQITGLQLGVANVAGGRFEPLLPGETSRASLRGVQIGILNDHPIWIGVGLPL